jgi:hypothetical protein
MELEGSKSGEGSTMEIAQIEAQGQGGLADAQMERDELKRTFGLDDRVWNGNYGKLNKLFITGNWLFDGKDEGIEEEKADEKSWNKKQQFSIVRFIGRGRRIEQRGWFGDGLISLFAPI